jgi:hypothetical protein
MGKIYEKIKNKTAKIKLSEKDNIVVITENGSETMEMSDYRQRVTDSLSAGATALVSQMNVANVDLTLLAPATFKSKKSYTVGGKKFDIDIHCLNTAVIAIGRQAKRELLSVIQIWNGSKSVLITWTKDKLDDARVNWRGENRIKADDILSQSVSALRLATDNPAVHHIAMFLAYEHDAIDSGGCHAVWD